jgi:transcriptional regulator with XRE-family HTH domain
MMVCDPEARSSTRVDQHVSRRIRGKRRALALTEDDLAKALGVERSMIEAYERAGARVPLEHLTRLSELLGVPVSYFLPAALFPAAPAANP